MADVPNKRILRYKMPILRNGQRTWVEIEEFDTCRGIIDNASEYFEAIMQDYLLYGKFSSGNVGAARSYLFESNNLYEFAKRWLERTFGRHLQ
jgi:aminoglycoside 3-N-acetyltransferase